MGRKLLRASLLKWIINPLSLFGIVAEDFRADTTIVKADSTIYSADATRL